MRSTEPASLIIRSHFTIPDTVPARAVMALGASVLVALCAHVSLPLPFTPVPLTLSDLAVLMIGMALGPVTAFSALMLYLLEGAMGLPVFTPGGVGGPAQLLGPTGGFLLAFPLVAVTAGFVSSRLAPITSRFAAGLVAGMCASLLLFACGVTWLAVLLHLSSGTAFHLAVQPFLPGNAIKIVIAAASCNLIQRFRQSTS